jgi:hypothetical protein
MAQQQLLAISVALVAVPGIWKGDFKSFSNLALGPGQSIDLLVRNALENGLTLMNFPYKNLDQDVLRSMIDRVQLFDVNRKLYFDFTANTLLPQITSMFTSGITTGMNIYATPRNLGSLPRSIPVPVPGTLPLRRTIPGLTSSARLVYVNKRTGEVAEPLTPAMSFVASASQPRSSGFPFFAPQPILNMSTLQPVGGILPINYQASPLIGQKIANVAGLNMSVGLNNPFNAMVAGLPAFGVVSTSYGNGAKEIARHIGQNGIFREPILPGFSLLGGGDDLTKAEVLAKIRGPATIEAAISLKPEILTMKDILDGVAKYNALKESFPKQSLLRKYLPEKYLHAKPLPAKPLPEKSLPEKSLPEKSLPEKSAPSWLPNGAQKGGDGDYVLDPEEMDSDILDSYSEQ